MTIIGVNSAPDGDTEKAVLVELLRDDAPYTRN
jgi:hypothetical protein